MSFMRITNCFISNLSPPRFQGTKLFYLKALNKFQFLSLKVKFSSAHFPFEKLRNLQKDVVLYSLDKAEFLKYLSIFGVAQLVLCTSYASTLFSLRETNKPANGEKASWMYINVSSLKSRLISVSICMVFGLLTAFVSYSLPYRIIKQLTLLKGGDIVSIVTYGPFGKTRQFSVPLRKISSMVTRQQAKSYIPFKIQNKVFYYLIDSKGKFHQPNLFDLSVGTKAFKL